MKITRTGKFQVPLAGTLHNEEKEAYESAVNYLLAHPDIESVAILTPGLVVSRDRVTPTPIIDPPVVVPGEKYRGIPDPALSLGFDAWAQYVADESITGDHRDYVINVGGSPGVPRVYDATRASFQRLRVTAPHVIVIGGHLNAPRSSGPFVVTNPHVLICDLVMSGPKTDQSHSSAVGMADNSVWLRGEIHGFGDNRTEAREQDFHGFKVMSDNVWILDAEIYDMSGDSVQVGDASRGAAKNVYIGGGYFHDNRENGVDIKDSTNVVVSGNTMSGFRATPGNDPGAAIVIHDDAYSAKIFDNTLLDTNVGIVSSGRDGHVINKNNIVARQKGMELRNTKNLTVTENTVDAPARYDVQSGVTFIERDF